jgi:hypothetical protein
MVLVVIKVLTVVVVAPTYHTRRTCRRSSSEVVEVVAVLGTMNTMSSMELGPGRTEQELLSSLFPISPFLGISMLMVLAMVQLIILGQDWVVQEQEARC